MGLDLAELPSYLMEDNLSLKEKEEKMDDLKALYDEMVEKVACFEMRCEYMEKQLNNNEKKKKKIKKKLLPVKSSNYKGQNFDLKQFEPFEGEDPFLPDGWKTGWRTMDGFAKETGSKIRVFWDPHGKFCYSRANALKMMTKELESPKEDIEQMKKGLTEDGWFVKKGLPEGWMMKLEGRDQPRRLFIDPKFQVHRKLRTATQELITSDYSERDLSEFVTRYILPVRGISSDDINWRHDDFIPSNWKVGICENKSRNGLFVLKPDGICLHSKNLIFEAINKSNLRQAEKEGFQKTLMKLKYGKSLESPNNNIKIEKENNEKDSKKKEDETDDSFDKDLKPKDNLTWLSHDLLPKGWKYADAILGEKGLVRRYMDTSTGKTFFSSSVALRFIFETQGRSSTLFRQFKSFMCKKDNYFETKYLPEGFMLRQKRSEAGFWYLTHKIERLNTLKKCLDYLRKNGFGKYAQEFKEKYSSLAGPYTYPKSKQKMYNKTADFLVQPYKTKSHSTRVSNVKWESSEPDDEEIDLSDSEFEDLDEMDDNKKDKTTSESKTKLNKIIPRNREKEKESDDEDSGHYSDADMDSDSEEAEQLNWNKNTDVPRGWKINTLDVKDGQMKGTRLTRYRSPCGNYFGNLPQVIKFLENHVQYSDEEKTFFKQGLPENGWREMDYVAGIRGTWYTKHCKGRGLLYLSPKYDVLDAEDIRLYLKDDEENHYGLETIDAFMAKSKKIIWKPDSTLPPNWKIGCSVDISGEQIKKFQTPTAEVFDSRPEAIKFMIESKNYCNDDITRMQLGMSDDDWMFDEHLPVGWFKKKYGSIWFFSTSKFQVLKSPEEVITHFNLTGASQETIQKFRNIQEETELSHPVVPTSPRTPTRSAPGPSTPLSPATLESPASPLTPASNRVKVKQETDQGSDPVKRKSPTEKENNNKRVKTEPTENPAVTIKKENLDESLEEAELPPGWRFGKVDNEEVLFNDKNVKFKSRRDAAEHMIKQNFNPKLIFGLWSTLDREGWLLSNDMIPSGWRIKSYPSLDDYKYITRDVTILHSTEEALKHIKDTPDLETQIEMFEKWASEVRMKETKKTWRSDTSVPPDWCLHSASGKEILKFKTTGGRFENRIDAIDFMIKNSQSSTDIFTMWNSLSLEGWVSDEDHVPRGWRRKTSKEGDIFLSPMMETIKTCERMLSILKTNKEYSEEDVAKFEKLMNK